MDHRTSTERQPPRQVDGAEAPELADALATADLRWTGPRRTVMSLVAARGRRHFSAADLVDDARRRGIRIGRATVFRTLDRLVAGGFIERIDLPDREHAYVACLPSHHHHVICTDCGRSNHVDDGDLRGVIAAVERSTGYAIEGHRLELFGRCPSCLGRGEA